MERRRFIAVGAASVGLAGCLGGDSDPAGNATANGDGSTPANGTDERGPTPCTGAAPASPISTAGGDGQFLVDGHGRTVLLHGANVVYKRPPYYPHEGVFDSSDVEKIRNWGFNFARLGAIWAGVQPERDEFDRDYLDNILDRVRLFAEQDIYVLLDYHQNLYSHVLGGDGAPEWAVFTEGELADYEYDDVSRWAANYVKPAVSNALRNFWTNHEGIQAEYARAWRETAAVLHDEPNVVGYSLMNEPTPALGMSDFETDALPEMYNRVIDEIRTVDTETPVWVEPSAAVFNVGGQTQLSGVTDPADNLVFSYHNYRGDNRAVVQNAVAATDRLGMPGVQTEFSTGNSTAVAAMVDELDRELMGWAYWPYDESTAGWQSPAEYPPDFIGLDEGGGRKHLKYLVRPYPQAVAGVPTAIDWDRVGREFHLAYEVADANGATVVFVPDRQFDDPEVTVEGASALCFENESLHVGEHTGDTVTISIAEDAIYRVENVNSEKVLTAPGGGEAGAGEAGATVHQRAWEESDAQRWAVTPLPDGGYRVDSVATGETLAVREASEADGADVVLRSWDGGDDQRWRVDVTSNAASRLENANSGRVLDVTDASTADGANVQQWAATGGANQQWRLRRD